MTLDCEVVLTSSGARAMRDRTTGELMHPVVGPLVEAERLYVTPSRLAARLQRAAEDPATDALVLLDVGLGAASNAIAAWHISESLPQPRRRLKIVSFDRSVVALQLALHPEHARDFALDGDAGVAARALLDTQRHDTQQTSWQLVHADLLDALARAASSSADVVFWDPFSPSANPALWTVGAFTLLHRLCRAGATLHTYSSATAVRSALLLAGFAVGAGVTVGTGRQSTCAAINAEDLAEPLDRRWLQRLARSSAPFPSDAPADALEQISALPQFCRG